MPATFDPYSEWLKLSATQRPPDHYALLGLPPFASDPAEITLGYRTRLSQIRKYQSGTRSEVATRLLNELSEAYECLREPPRRAAYDETLGGPPRVESKESVDSLEEMDFWQFVESLEPPPVVGTASESAVAVIEPPPIEPPVEPPVEPTQWQDAVDRHTDERNAERRLIAAGLTIVAAVGIPLLGLVAWNHISNKSDRSLGLAMVDSAGNKTTPEFGAANSIGDANDGNATAGSETSVVGTAKYGSAGTSPPLGAAGSESSTGGRKVEFTTADEFLTPSVDEPLTPVVPVNTSVPASLPAPANKTTAAPSAAAKTAETVTASPANNELPRDSISTATPASPSQPVAETDAGSAADDFSGVRHWNNKDGGLIVAGTYLSFERGVVHFQDENGEELKIQIDTLCPDDKARVRELARRDALAATTIVLGNVERLMSVGNFDGARELLEPCRAVSVGDIRAEAMLGLIATLARNQTAEASKHFQACVSRVSTNVACLNNLAIVKTAECETKIAVRHWSTAWKLEPNSPTLRHNLQRFVWFASNGRISADRGDINALQKLLVSSRTVPAVGHQGWRYMTVGVDAAGIMTSLVPPAVGRLPLDDRRCLICKGRGQIQCPNLNCRSTSKVSPGRQVIRKFQEFCPTCANIGWVGCQYCNEGTINE